MAPPLRHPGLDTFLKNAKKQLESLKMEMSPYDSKVEKLQKVSGPHPVGQPPSQSDWNYTVADVLISHVVFIGYMRQTLQAMIQAFDEVADELPKR